MTDSDDAVVTEIIREIVKHGASAGVTFRQTVGGSTPARYPTEAVLIITAVRMLAEAADAGHSPLGAERGRIRNEPGAPGRQHHWGHRLLFGNLGETPADPQGGRPVGVQGRVSSDPRVAAANGNSPSVQMCTTRQVRS